jgi:hypothetical protein
MAHPMMLPVRVESQQATPTASLRDWALPFLMLLRARAAVQQRGAQAPDAREPRHAALPGAQQLPAPQHAEPRRQARQGLAERLREVAPALQREEPPPAPPVRLPERRRLWAARWQERLR